MIISNYIYIYSIFFCGNIANGFIEIRFNIMQVEHLIFSLKSDTMVMLQSNINLGV